jgi:RNA polymerase sigma factor (sigma-70 family)
MAYIAQLPKRRWQTNFQPTTIFSILLRHLFQMNAITLHAMPSAADQRIADTIEREQPRLQRFIRSRVAQTSDAEDILQEVFEEFVVAYRLMQPIEQAGAWLFRVARNRITDLFRRKGRRPALEARPDTDTEDGEISFDELLPSPEEGPEAALAREILLGELEEAIADLPEDQRSVFIAHEFEGRSFSEMAAETGLSINTLLARKRYAVLRLRARLEDIYQELNEPS